MENKRKGTSDGRKSRRKKMKFERLEGWGEDNEGLDVVEVMEVVDSSPVDVKETVIEIELKSGLKEPSRTKKLISEGVRKAKFNFKILLFVLLFLNVRKRHGDTIHKNMELR